MKFDLKQQQIPYIWYHGTTQFYARDIRNEIDLEISEPDVDFGKGFYLTSNASQAWIRGSKKTNLHNMNRNKILKENPGKKIPIGAPAIVVFELNLETLSLLNGEIFRKEDENWAKFILGNRSPNELSIVPLHNRDRKFDYVYGPMADGYGLTTLIEEAAETEDISTFLNQIVGKRANFPDEDQLSIHTEAAKLCLTWKGAMYNEPSKSIGKRT
ncbi:DUF3990 domain-containing protein [Priestia megaterium]